MADQVLKYNSLYFTVVTNVIVIFFWNWMEVMVGM